MCFWLDIIHLHCTDGIHQERWKFLLCQQILIYCGCSNTAVRSKAYRLMCFCENRLIILDFTVGTGVTYWHIVNTDTEEDPSTKMSQLQKQQQLRCCNFLSTSAKWSRSSTVPPFCAALKRVQCYYRGSLFLYVNQYFMFQRKLNYGEVPCP